MKLSVINLDNAKLSDLNLDTDVFGVEVRADILQRVVEWQRSKRRSGNHKTKGISEVSGTGKKPYKQKGTGRARQGSLRSPQFRGGAIIFGPVVRSHEYSLNKKFRKLGLRMAIRSKFDNGQLAIVDSLDLSSGKTKDLKLKLNNLGMKSVLFVENDEVKDNLRNATSNLINVDVLPQIGANVYDILRHDNLVITSDAMQALTERLK